MATTPLSQELTNVYCSFSTGIYMFSFATSCPARGQERELGERESSAEDLACSSSLSARCIIYCSWFIHGGALGLIGFMAAPQL